MTQDELNRTRKIEREEKVSFTSGEAGEVIMSLINEKIKLKETIDEMLLRGSDSIQNKENERRYFASAIFNAMIKTNREQSDPSSQIKVSIEYATELQRQLDETRIK